MPFASDDYQVMLVANKLQTGFEQPLLVAMDLGKKLSGVTAVHTRSRLSRNATDKDQTFVLDAGDRARLEELELFRGDLHSLIPTYDFLSQIINDHDTALEKRSIFYRLLAPLISDEDRDRSIDLAGVKLTHRSLRPEEVEDLQLSVDGDPLRQFTAAGSGVAKDPELARLQEAIEKMNTLFEGDELTDADMVDFTGYVGGKFDESETLWEQAKANTLEQFLCSSCLLSARERGGDYPWIKPYSVVVMRNPEREATVW